MVDRDIMLSALNIVSLIVIGFFQYVNRVTAKDTNKTVRATETKVDQVHDATNGRLGLIESTLKNAQARLADQDQKILDLELEIANTATERIEERKQSSAALKAAARPIKRRKE